MNKTYKIASALFLILVIGLTWLESSEPDPINWTPSYTSNDALPLGAKVFFKSWQDSREDEIVKLKVPPYEFLNDLSPNGTYFFLNDHIGFDDKELDHLLEWVSKGNTLFISAYGFGSNLQDTLNVELKSFINSKGFTSTQQLNLANPLLNTDRSFEFDQDLPAVYFSKIDTLNQTVLGFSSFDVKKDAKKVNFIKSPFGKGEIYLHTVPQSFGNYFLLKDNNYAYAENLLAYFKNDEILWDAYYKSGKSFFSSPLYILLNNRPLKWSYYFVLIGAVLFIIFEGKRKQRPIPVVEPLKNKSFEYTGTIANLYLEQQRYRELGLKKIMLFLEYIRLEYRLETQNPDKEFIQNLSARSGNDPITTEALFKQIKAYPEQQRHSKKDFMQLSERINSFKNKDGK
ncbi:DUF4350 domain-containing protein [Christiangramia aquimixticola]|uniref:DUF4350 domain-containing protein n=1 Tax=Christiangramia aquimixticola TaxID=1697558 RepID=UPI003AA8CA07